MTGNKTIKVVLTDDHKIVREGIKLLIEKDSEIEVVAMASNGIELLSLLETIPADLVLLDICMPQMDGCEAAKQIRSRFPNIKVLALTMLEEEEQIRKLIEAGAAGYIVKKTSLLELKAAIKLVASGSKFMGTDLFKKLQQQPAKKTDTSITPLENIAMLSKREIEVLQLVAEGYTNQEIADKLFTSKRTIETHRQNSIKKTNTRNTASLIKYCILHGFISIN